MFKKKKQLSPLQQMRQRRLEQQVPSTQDSLGIQRIYEDGLIKINEKEYSRQYDLNDIAYEAAGIEQQADVVFSYVKALNGLNHHHRYQLFVRNEKIDEKSIQRLMRPLVGDANDIYRKEINQLMHDRVASKENQYKAKRSVVFTTEAKNEEEANKVLNTIALSFAHEFQNSGLDLRLKPLNGEERVAAINKLTNPGFDFPKPVFTMGDNKDLIASSTAHFDAGFFKVNEKFGRVLFIRDYPEQMEDKLIRELTKLNREIVVSLQARAYNVQDVKKRLKRVTTLNKMDIVRQQKDNFRDGVGEEMVSGMSSEILETTNALKDELRNNQQKIFNGVFSVMFFADKKEDLKDITEEIKGVGQGESVNFESCYTWQEEGLNTILPFGYPYLETDLAPEHMRDLTTDNIATQVPFESVEIQSEGGEYFGQNQISKNPITIDRKNKEELFTPSGITTGTSGSGKSVATKIQILNTLLYNPGDRIIIVDPESEYLPIGRKLGAEILDISTGTNNHFNILDLADRKNLDEDDRKLDLVKEKTNLLTNLLDEMVGLSASQKGIIDRVTQETYQKYEKPTLFEWQEVLKQQTDYGVEELANAMYSYTQGSQNIFAFETNIDLSAPFIIFNTKNLDNHMKPFAMKVILDQIWKQVVSYQGQARTWLYFDEIQVNFDTEDNASWFANLWTRVRKYGAIPTGITQNIGNLLSKEAGIRMVTNSEFMMLLKQKGPDLDLLEDTLGLDRNLLDQFCGHNPEKGTGLIQANGVMVPFENKIPENTELFKLLNTDV